MQEEVAQKIGTKQNTYSEYENGKRIIKIDLLIKLSYLYNFPADFIIMPEKYPLDSFSELVGIGQDVKQMVEEIIKMPQCDVKIDALASLGTLNLGIETLKRFNKNQSKN